MAPADTLVTEPSLPPTLRLAFAPLHKRAFGIAVGTATGLLIALATLVYLIRGGINTGPGLWLLRNYFAGYEVSIPGVLIGGAWGFFVGFVGGWFIAFCRNFAIAASVFVFRIRAEMNQTRDFLDHI